MVRGKRIQFLTFKREYLEVNKWRCRDRKLEMSLEFRKRGDKESEFGSPQYTDGI